MSFSCVLHKRPASRYFAPTRRGHYLELLINGPYDDVMLLDSNLARRLAFKKTGGELTARAEQAMRGSRSKQAAGL